MAERENSMGSIGVQADVSEEASVVNAVEATLHEFQRTDIFVNNGAVNLPYRAVHELTLEDWNRVLAINLTCTFLCTRAVLLHMIAQCSGKIINMASIGGRWGLAGRVRVPYRPTKAAIINFTECVAAEVKIHNIDVNAICPAVVVTDMIREILGDGIPAAVTPVEDVALLALFLCSNESASVTGTAIDAFGLSNPLFR